MTKDARNYWCYNHEEGWERVTLDNHLHSSSTNDFISEQGFDDHPDFFFGNELDFIAIFIREEDEMHLIHMLLTDTELILFAKNLPSLLEILHDLLELLNAHLMIEDVINRSCDE